MYLRNDAEANAVSVSEPAPRFVKTMPNIFEARTRLLQMFRKNLLHEKKDKHQDTFF
jgi:hypothetical protein